MVAADMKAGLDHQEIRHSLHTHQHVGATARKAAKLGATVARATAVRTRVRAKRDMLGFEFLLFRQQ